MANAVERVCCKSHPCISTDVFHETCLNRNVLTVAILDSNDFYNDDDEMSTRKQHTDNASFIAMVT